MSKSEVTEARAASDPGPLRTQPASTNASVLEAVTIVGLAVGVPVVAGVLTWFCVLP